MGKIVKLSDFALFTSMSFAYFTKKLFQALTFIIFYLKIREPVLTKQPQK